MDETESILNSVKQILGPGASDSHFDPDIIMHINTVFASLTEFGFGPEDGFTITGTDEKWSDFITLAPKQFSMIKSYMYLRVRKLFDPPQSSVLMNAIDQEIAQLEWRITVWTEFVKSQKSN